MTAVAGLRGTGDWSAGQRPLSWREYILWRDPNGQAPLQALMARMASERPTDPEFNWFEEQLDQAIVTTSGAITSETTIPIVSGGKHLVEGDLLLVQLTQSDANYDIELLEVTGHTGGSEDTSIVVARGARGTTQNNIAGATDLVRVGNAYEEGGMPPKSATRNPTKFNNYCQIFRTTYDLTKTVQVTKTRTGPEMENDKKRKLFDHSVSMELAYLWGVPFEETAGPVEGKPRRSTGGLRHYLQLTKTADPVGSKHCVHDFGGTPTTEDDILEASYRMWDYRGQGGSRGGNQRIGLCGNGYLNELNKIARDSGSTRINFDGVLKTYGMNLQRWILPQGEIYVRTHPLLNTNTAWSHSAFFLHGGNLKDMALRPTKFDDSVEPKGKDSRMGEWLTESGCEFHHLKTMAYQFGIAK